MKTGWTCLKLSKDAAVASYLRHFVPIVGRLHEFPTRLKIILGRARTVWERVWFNQLATHGTGQSGQHREMVNLWNIGLNWLAKYGPLIVV